MHLSLLHLVLLSIMALEQTLSRRLPNRLAEEYSVEESIKKRGLSLAGATKLGIDPLSCFIAYV